MNRTPPLEVQRQLRREVKYGCPVPDCGNPFLYWHHFDPAWNVEEHHRPDGMIALCGEHHPKADAGAYTIEQLRGFKSRVTAMPGLVQGKIEWMRQDLVLVLGSNLYVRTPVAFRFKQSDVISVPRNDEGLLTVSARMLTNSNNPRLTLVENFFEVDPSSPDLDDFHCPPSGRLVEAKYANGDLLRVEFQHVKTTASTSPTVAGKQRYSSPVRYATLHSL